MTDDTAAPVGEQTAASMPAPESLSPATSPTIFREIEADLHAILAKLDIIGHNLAAELKSDITSLVTKIKGVL